MVRVKQTCFDADDKLASNPQTKRAALQPTLAKPKAGASGANAGTSAPQKAGKRAQEPDEDKENDIVWVKQKWAKCWDQARSENERAAAGRSELAAASEKILAQAQAEDTLRTELERVNKQLSCWRAREGRLMAGTESWQAVSRAQLDAANKRTEAVRCELAAAQEKAQGREDILLRHSRGLVITLKEARESVRAMERRAEAEEEGKRQSDLALRSLQTQIGLDRDDWSAELAGAESADLRKRLYAREEELQRAQETAQAGTQTDPPAEAAKAAPAAETLSTPTHNAPGNPARVAARVEIEHAISEDNKAKIKQVLAGHPEGIEHNRFATKW
ncbi:hypothetical protein T484DRAFT_2026611, partial [Baffinella frigidus]